MPGSTALWDPYENLDLYRQVSTCGDFIFKKCAPVSQTRNKNYSILTAGKRIVFYVLCLLGFLKNRHYPENPEF